ncbi:MAG: hypothetical protein LBR60_01500 [Fibrobacter sp.]|jgi:hypothetical protein|nr:hypothetical protein [Fibrobacter sp.]
MNQTTLLLNNTLFARWNSVKIDTSITTDSVGVQTVLLAVWVDGVKAHPEYYDCATLQTSPEPFSNIKRALDDYVAEGIYNTVVGNAVTGSYRAVTADNLITAVRNKLLKLNFTII